MNPEQLFAALNELGTRGIPAPQICMGTVGWEEDDSHFDLGDKTNDGHTLVKVQLFEGRDSTKPIVPGVGQGRKLLCQLATSVFEIPPAGTRVFVAMPMEGSSSPGAGVVFAAVEKDHRYNLTDGSVQITTRDGAGQVVVRPDGSVTMFSSDDNGDNGKSVYFRVKPDAFQWVAPWGTIRFDASGFHILTQSGAAFDLGGIGGLPAPMDQLASYAKLSAAMIDLEGSAISAGAGAVPVASAVPVLTAITAISTALAALKAALDVTAALGSPAITPAHIGTLSTALGTALGTMGTSLAAAALLTPTIMGAAQPPP